METTITVKNPMDAVLEDVKWQLERCREVADEAAREMGKLKGDSEAFNRAWDRLANVNAVEYQLLALKNFAGEHEAMAESFIRFTVGKLEAALDKADSECGRAQRALLSAFRKYLHYLTTYDN